jgi:hypothetical protein
LLAFGVASWWRPAPKMRHYCRNGYCSSSKRGRLSLEQFKIVYFEKMQALKKSLRANRLNEFKAYLKKLIISIFIFLPLIYYLFACFWRRQLVATCT